MALPQTDLDWLNYLAIRHDAEKGELEAYDRYYDGTQPLTYMHPEILREVRDRIAPVVIAWPQLVVDSVEERLDVVGFHLPDEDGGDDDLFRVWQSNDMDEQSQLGHVDALTMRRYYVSVGSREGDPDTPRLVAESPLEVFADIDPRDRTVRAALKRVVEEDQSVGTNARYATLYLPNVTVWYEWRGGWLVVDRDEHNLGQVPVVPIVNRGRLAHTARRRDGVTRTRYGRSELDPVIPLSDAANKIATDMMLAAEFLALPLRGFWGLGPDDLVDEDGNRLTAIQAIMGRLLTLTHPEDQEGKEFEFRQADLANFHNSIDSLAKLVASIAGLPPHYLGQATTNPASADAIRSAEARLVKRAERKQRAFGGGYEQVMRLVRRFQTGEWDPRLRRLETMWRDASTPTVAQAADAAVKKFQAGITTRRQAREDLGYTDTQIRLMEADDEIEARRDPVGMIAQGLADRPEPASAGS